MYPVFVVGIYYKGCVIVRESVKTQAIEARRVFMGIMRLSILRKEACALHMTGMRRVGIDGDSCVSRVARIKDFLRDTRKTLCSARLYYLIHTFWSHTIYTLIIHKCKGELLRENPSKNTWELEIVIPTILYTFVEFPHLLPLHFHTIERLRAQTITTPFESVKWGFGAAGKHWKKSRMADAT